MKMLVFNLEIILIWIVGRGEYDFWTCLRVKATFFNVFVDSGQN